MIFKKIILILIVALLCKCELPTENINYIQSPVVFGYIDAGFNRIDTLYLYWTSSLTSSHFENNYIDNASVNLSSGNQNIELNHIGNGKYLPVNLRRLQQFSEKGLIPNAEIVNKSFKFLSIIKIDNVGGFDPPR